MVAVGGVVFMIYKRGFKTQKLQGRKNDGKSDLIYQTKE